MAAGYPQPPLLVQEFIDTVLRENAVILAAAKSCEDAGQLEESAACVKGEVILMQTIKRKWDIYTHPPYPTPSLLLSE